MHVTKLKNPVPYRLGLVRFTASAEPYMRTSKKNGRPFKGHRPDVCMPLGAWHLCLPQTDHVAQVGAWLLPHRHRLIGYTMNRGEWVHFKDHRWDHIKSSHIYNQPTRRGKRYLTYWPVRYSTGIERMSERAIIDLIMLAARTGRRQPAKMGKSEILFTLETPICGVSKIMVVLGCTGNVVTAYPLEGESVLSLREMSTFDWLRFTLSGRWIAAAMSL